MFRWLAGVLWGATPLQVESAAPSPDRSDLASLVRLLGEADAIPAEDAADETIGNMMPSGELP